MYKHFVRPVLFLFGPEFIHHFTFRLLQIITRIPGVKSLLRRLYCETNPGLRRNILGLSFDNPVGLAAGFDKNAEMINELACLGFGFIEIGTLTPHPQPGNEKPRLFRLRKDQALINRMGFNNCGAKHAVEYLKKRTAGIIVGGNIGKNKQTPNENAAADYIESIKILFPYVDYFVVNVSSPNTPDLRELQEKEPLKKLLNQVIAFSKSKEKSKPIFLKIAPDLTESQLSDIVIIIKETGTDGVIATNSTTSREGLSEDINRIKEIGLGGLSGKPLSSKSTEVIRFLRSRLGPGVPIIGVGGIMSAEDAIEKLEAGADLLQVYTGFIYEGPGFVKRINQWVMKEYPIVNH